MEEESTSHPILRLPRWIDRVAKSSAKKDRIEGSDLVGEVVAFIFMSLALWFFVAHKLEETGFYTDGFGAVEMTALYSAGGFVVFVAAVRIAIRRHNLVRPLEAASFVLLGIAHAILLVGFPFDFDHVADVLPRTLEWIVGWMSDTIGAVILALGIPGSIVGAVVTVLIYFGVREELSKATDELQAPTPPTTD